MTKDKSNEVCDLYIEVLKDTTHEELKYVLRMLIQIKEFDDIGKRNRWLGFIQGVLWTSDIFSIDEMRKHNREE